MERHAYQPIWRAPSVSGKVPQSHWGTPATLSERLQGLLKSLLCKILNQWHPSPGTSLARLKSTPAGESVLQGWRTYRVRAGKAQVAPLTRGEGKSWRSRTCLTYCTRSSWSAAASFATARLINDQPKSSQSPQPTCTPAHPHVHLDACASTVCRSIPPICCPPPHLTVQQQQQAQQCTCA